MENKVIEFKILDDVRENGHTTIQEVSDNFDLHRYHAGKILKAMVDIGILKRKGKKRSFKYFLPKETILDNHWTKGDVVTVYEHPVMKVNPEGDAKLIEKLKEFENTEKWLVQFRGEFRLFKRTISKKGMEEFKNSYASMRNAKRESYRDEITEFFKVPRSK